MSGRLLAIAFSSNELEPIGGFARSLNLSFDVILLSEEIEIRSDADNLYFLSEGSPLTADAVSNAISGMVGHYTHVAAVSSMASKDLMPRIAALVDGAMVTDVTNVIEPTLFKRSVQAGAVVATVRTLVSPVVATFRPSGFDNVESLGQPTFKRIEIPPSNSTKILGDPKPKQTRPDLSQAKLVVSGGRPLRDSDTFERVIGGFADQFGGAVGATRAAVDAGIAPNEAQVGQTGKIVAPDLYVAAGISGSTQHMAGVRDSRYILAINKDPDAAIFTAADFGIVGDLFEILPKLASALEEGSA